MIQVSPLAIKLTPTIVPWIQAELRDRSQQTRNASKIVKRAFATTHPGPL
jgi:hypothetical protein